MTHTLLVEDNDAFRKAIRETLIIKFPSMSIEEAIDGKEAMEKFKTLHPDLIFMDIRLPGETGLVLTQRIKKLSTDVVIVILTAYDLPEYREAARESGADYFLTKGTTTASEIIALVESIQSKYEAPGHLE